MEKDKTMIPLDGTDETRGEMVTMHVVGDAKKRTSDGIGSRLRGI